MKLFNFNYVEGSTAFAVLNYGKQYSRGDGHLSNKKFCLEIPFYFFRLYFYAHRIYNIPTIDGGFIKKARPRFHLGVETNKLVPGWEDFGIKKTYDFGF